MRCLLPEDFFVDDSMINMLYFFYPMMLCNNP